MTSGGIVAVGDSITAHCSPDLVFDGVPPRSWVEWFAASVGLPLTTYARSGADSAEILALLPDSLPDSEIGFVFAGVNNTLSWRRHRKVDFEGTLTELVQRVKRVSSRVVLVQVPVPLGQGFVPFAYGPGLRGRIARTRAVIEQVAEREGAALVELPKFVKDELWLDRVHPTSTGHLATADHMLAALGYEQRASDLERTYTPTRADMRAWKLKAAARHALKSPALGFAGWAVGR